MRVSQPQKPLPKHKYLKPQVFSLGGHSSNTQHCRSLVDLNNIDTSAQKQNKNIDHFASLNSNTSQLHDKNDRQNSSKCVTKNYIKVNCSSGNNNNGKENSVVGNVSNIAKILMQASKTTKNVDNRSQQSSSKINNNGTKKTDLLADIVNNRYKKQARTSSQTNLRQPTNLSLPKQTNLQSQKSQKNLNLNLKLKPQLSQSSLAQPSPDYNLLIKLKQYIEQLKQNQQTHIQKITSLSQKNTALESQVVLLRDKIQVLQIREKEMLKKIKSMENRGSCSNGQGRMEREKGGQCEEHMVIIQSLKNVIDEQMNKIIQMEAYKIHYNEHRKGNVYANTNTNMHVKGNNNINNTNNKVQGSQYQNTMQSQKEKESRFQEVYSFKKRNNLNESSIYIEDEEQGYAQLERNLPMRNNNNNNNSHNNNNNNNNSHNNNNNNSHNNKTNKNSLSSIPQPYSELLKCLKSDSRTKKQSQAQNSRASLNSSLKSQSSDSDIINHEYSNYPNYEYNSYKINRQHKQQPQYSSSRNKNNIYMQRQGEDGGYYRGRKQEGEDGEDGGKQGYGVYEEEEEEEGEGQGMGKPAGQTGNNKYQQQCSEDEILMEVGNYLQNIRRNVRQN